MNRLLLDQGVSRSAAHCLRAAGWDVIHVCERELSTASDSAILEYARSEKRTVCTLDADFHAILALSGYCDPSVIRLRREGLKGQELAELLQLIWPQIAEAIQSGAMVTVTEHSIRVRRLPVV